METWDNYAKVTDLNKLDREKQVSTFFSFCKKEFLSKIRHAMNIPQSTTKTLPAVLQEIRTYLRNQQDTVSDRYKLLRRKQAANESFDDFLVDLKDMADDADINNMSGDDWRCTLIVHNLHNNEHREELLGKKPSLSLDETILFCRNKELAMKGNKDMRGRASINANTSGDRGRSRSRSRSRGRRDESKSDAKSNANVCYGCGGSYPHGKDKTCPAKGKKCNSCNGANHFAKMCKKKSQGGANASTTPSKVTTGAVNVAGIRRPCDRPEIAVNFYFKGQFIDNRCCVADTGAMVTVAGRDVLKRWDLTSSDLHSP